MDTELIARLDALDMWEQLLFADRPAAEKIADAYRGELEQLHQDGTYEARKGQFPQLIEELHKALYAVGLTIVTFKAGANTPPEYSVPSQQDIARADAYADYMTRAHATWEPVVSKLQAATGIECSVWQTGGGCLAIGGQLPGDWYFMLTDENGPLTVDASAEQEARWTLGIYKAEEDEDPYIIEGPYQVYAGQRSHDDQFVAWAAPLLKRIAA